jgi:hypothetical protein
VRTAARPRRGTSFRALVIIVVFAIIYAASG